jgi:anti-sigma-K factor RskA
MDVKAYIDSGILELYVAGQLSDQENTEVAQNATSHLEIKNEIEAIEKAILALTAGLATSKVPVFDIIKGQLKAVVVDEAISTEVKRLPWMNIIGLAAVLILGIGTFFLYNQNQNLSEKLKVAETEIEQMEQQIAEAATSIEKSDLLLSELRDKNVTVVQLGGQATSPDSYAKAYWNTEKNQLFIDAQGLPEPPEGMVYQVWSLKLNPLTPTSVGLLADFVNDENKVFTLANPNESQAFGITLEPAGGSETPTLEQLYVLGALSS